MADDVTEECKKTYVLDTNVLLSDPGSLFAFQEHDLIVPMAVLEELDRHKGRDDQVGRNARQVSRSLDSMRAMGNLNAGVPLPGGGTLKVISIGDDVFVHMPPELRDPKVDNQIIAFMVVVARSQLHGTAVLVSKDINVRIKCDSLGVKCEDYLRMRVTDDLRKFYRGVEVLELADARVDCFFSAGSLSLTAEELDDRRLYPNEIVVIKHVKDGQTSKSAITKYDDATGSIVPIAKIESAFGLKPRNKEQSFSLDLLFDDSIKLVTLVGQSGTGKTLLALAAGLAQLRTLGAPSVAKYDKLIVTRPIQPLGRDIGFLPGTLEEKMEPWVAPIRDNLNFLMDSHRNRPKRKASDRNVESKSPDDVYLQLMQDRGLIEIEAITYIRGRSIPNAFIIIDEAQNLSMHELKTIITRVGDGTKIVLTGDVEQIDNVHVDAFTNGLTCAVEKFKVHRIAGHVALLKGERSELATLASKIL